MIEISRNLGKFINTVRPSAYASKYRVLLLRRTSIFSVKQMYIYRRFRYSNRSLFFFFFLSFFISFFFTRLPLQFSLEYHFFFTGSSFLSVSLFSFSPPSLTSYFFFRLYRSSLIKVPPDQVSPFTLTVRSFISRFSR